jgi:hypothetical protein
VVAVALAVFLVLGVLVHGTDHGLAADDVFSRWIQRNFDVYTRYDMVQLTDAWVIIAASAVIAGLALLARRIDLAALAFAAPVIATGLTEYVFKPLFARTVPAVEAMTGQESEAYPSGHETAVSCVLVVLALVLLSSALPLTARVAGMLALCAYYVVTVFGLVGQYYHYLTDTIGALAVAVVMVLGGALGIDRTSSGRRRPGG